MFNTQQFFNAKHFIFAQRAMQNGFWWQHLKLWTQKYLFHMLMHKTKHSPRRCFYQITPVGYIFRQEHIEFSIMNRARGDHTFRSYDLLILPRSFNTVGLEYLNQLTVCTKGSKTVYKSVQTSGSFWEDIDFILEIVETSNNTNRHWKKRLETWI